MQTIGTAASHTFAFGLSFAGGYAACADRFPPYMAAKVERVECCEWWGGRHLENRESLQCGPGRPRATSRLCWQAVNSRRLTVARRSNTRLEMDFPPMAAAAGGLLPDAQHHSAGFCIQTHGDFFSWPGFSLFSCSYQDRVRWALYPGLLWILMPQTRLRAQLAAMLVLSRLGALQKRAYAVHILRTRYFAAPLRRFISRQK
ncbi:hypothetical protein B0T14DRAFT_295132 [Immersiella caudata]|uniref:Uncharacterized protein n=1 Tax=Immersiella caudata TaxID=314043 RepID=A0AA39WEU8_9PEZI|nr:hypothetical protein B0T14DRAFT_295132 [Immersiella caudata]